MSAGEDEAGWAVLQAAAGHAQTVLAGSLAGVYGVGSLAHGGFAAGVSDVDGVVIADRCDGDLPAAVAEITRRTVASCGGGGLAERLSLFWGDWPTFADPPATARLPPIVRLDLLRFGIPLHGDAPPDSLAEPSGDELVRESAAFAASWLERDPAPDPAALVAAGGRPLTKAVLFPVRFLATACAGLAGSNDEAVAWYLDAERPHTPWPPPRSPGAPSRSPTPPPPPRSSPPTSPASTPR